MRARRARWRCLGGGRDGGSRASDEWDEGRAAGEVEEVRAAGETELGR